MMMDPYLLQFLKDKMIESDEEIKNPICHKCQKKEGALFTYNPYIWAIMNKKTEEKWWCIGCHMDASESI